MAVKKSSVKKEQGIDSEEPVKKGKDQEGDELPDHAAIALRLEQIRNFSADPRFARILGYLQTFSRNPPQVLLLEGGTLENRLDAVDYWSLLLNCPNKAEHPCFTCPVCIKLATHLHRDCFFLDGSKGSIKIDTLRDEVKPALGESPREARVRVVTFFEAQAMTAPSANIMLKSLEEPITATSFVLVAPQRESLLPTLVSRSMILTLPWPVSVADAQKAPETAEEEQSIAVEADFCRFIETGRGLFQRTGQKGVFDMRAGLFALNVCRRALAAAIAGSAGSSSPSDQETLAGRLRRLPPERLRMLDEVYATAQDHLNAGVNPATTLEWVATRMFLLYPRKR